MDKFLEKYIESFGDPSSKEGMYAKDSKLAKAYEVALDIRKFEIELYWKRSTSFWLVVGGIAAALGLLLSGKGDLSSGILLSHRGKEIACFLLCLSGAIICYAWNLVNEGSKFWQRNWEYQVGILEQQVLGPLYKTVMSSGKSKTMYSVSKINSFIARYICAIFLLGAFVLLIGSRGLSVLLDKIGGFLDIAWIDSILKLVILIFHIWVFIKLKKSGQDRSKIDDFNSHIEVSVRRVIVEREPYGTAKDIWDAPVPKKIMKPDGSNIADKNLADILIRSIFKRSTD